MSTINYDLKKIKALVFDVLTVNYQFDFYSLLSALRGEGSSVCLRGEAAYGLVILFGTGYLGLVCAL